MQQPIAILMLLLFIFVLFVMISPGLQNNNIYEMSEGLKSVCAFLGPVTAVAVFSCFRNRND